MVSGSKMKAQTHAVFKIRADMHGDMILFLDLVSETLDLFLEVRSDMLGAGDPGEPFLHGVDLGHLQLA